jgi:hypothetical protein
MTASTAVTVKTEMGGAERAIRWTTTFSVVVLAVIAAVVSYKHMYLLVRRYGETSWTAALLPVKTVDGMIAALSMTLLLDSRQGRRSGLLPWVLLMVGSAGSLAANVAVAEPSVVGRLIAGWPSCALIGSYELLMSQIRHTAAARGAGRENVDIYVPHTAPEVAHTGPHTTSEAAHTLWATETASSYGALTNPLDSSGSSNGAHTDRPIDLIGASDRDAARPVDDARSRQASRRRVRSGSTAGAQQRAWRWAVANRTPEGDLPPGRAIAGRFGRSERWGRMVSRPASQDGWMRSPGSRPGRRTSLGALSPGTCRTRLLVAAIEPCSVWGRPLW